MHTDIASLSQTFGQNLIAAADVPSHTQIDALGDYNEYKYGPDPIMPGGGPTNDGSTTPMYKEDADTIPQIIDGAVINGSSISLPTIWITRNFYAGRVNYDENGDYIPQVHPVNVTEAWLGGFLKYPNPYKPQPKHFFEGRDILYASLYNSISSIIYNVKKWIENGV